MAVRTHPASRRVISVFTLSMINVAAIASLKNLPMMAEYGMALVFYESFLAAGLVVLAAPPFLIYRFRKASWNIV